MPEIVATNIIVFGRGLIADNSGFRLTRASAERAEVLVAYVSRNTAVFNSRQGRVVFTGGWAAAAEGIEPPPIQFREGSLMLDQAKAADIDGKNLVGYADAYSEIESDSTLENVLRSKEGGYFEGISFTRNNPLGLVAHQEHLVRIDYLVRKVFRLPSGAIVHIVVPGADNFSGRLPESVILFLTRLAFIGARGDTSLRRRHRILVACPHRLHSHRLQTGRP
jgi:hypothetical protein